MMDGLAFPLFLQDRDEWITMIEKEEELNGKLEWLDVEDHEYTGWDLHGHPVELYLQDKLIKARILSNHSEAGALKEALLHYASLVCQKIPSSQWAHVENVVDLFRAIETRAAERGLRRKVQQWLQRFIQQAPPPPSMRQ